MDIKDIKRWRGKKENLNKNHMKNNYTNANEINSRFKEILNLSISFEEYNKSH